MRLQVLALDYDGTIALDGGIDPEVARAIAEAREQGVAVLLVTGRILADLERLLADPTMFDAIVAENGAVLHFPDSERSVLLAAAPPAAFLDELRHRHVPFLAGECVVEADASQAPAVLEVVRETQLPLVLLFNRGRLMVLPQAVSKATGLREALRALRLSQHNTVGIGDAENDHQLLSFCEIGAAVSWGSRALQAVADEIVPGNGPHAVAEYIRSLLGDPGIQPERLDRRRIHLGVNDAGSPFGLATRGRNVLIAGDTQSGKSWVAGVLCEQLVLEHYCVCVIDPEGEYGTLETLPSVVVLDMEPCPPDRKDLERTLRYPDVSAVFDLSSLDLSAKRRYVIELFEHLYDLRRRTGVPHRIVIDEAHYFLSDSSVVELLDFELGGYTFITWHASQLHPDVLSAADIIIATRISDREEAEALHELRGRGQDFSEWFATLRGLGREHAALLPDGHSETQLLRFRVSARLTAHVRHRRKYLNVEAPGGRFFVFDDKRAEPRQARSLGELVEVLARAPELDAHLERGDLSRWVRDVFGDRVLANRLQTLEEQWRVGKLEHPNLALISAIRQRFAADAERPDVSSLSAGDTAAIPRGSAK